MTLLCAVDLPNNDWDGIDPGQQNVVCGYHVPADMGLDFNGTGVTYRCYIDAQDLALRGLNNPRAGFSKYFGGYEPDSVPVRAWADAMVKANDARFADAQIV